MAVQQQFGKVFEEELMGEWNVKASALEDDLYKGVDFRINGLPIDITYNFTEKDHCERFTKTFTLPGGVAVEYGFRLGNSHKGFTAFDEPVLVIGVQLPSPQYANHVVEQMGKFKEQITMLGEDLYWAKFDEMEGLA